MKMVIDESIRGPQRTYVEQVIKAVLGLHPRADLLLCSVVRLGPGRCNVFVTDPDPGQFALLPEGAIRAYEQEILAALRGIV